MASTGIAATGTLLQHGDGASPEVFTTVAEVYAISGPNPSAEEVDITNHDSANDFREYVSGFLDGGSVSFSCNFLPANSTQNSSTGVISYFDARATDNWQIVFPDTGTTTASFAAYVQSYNPTANVGERLSADITLRVTGQVTWA